ncbi:MAG: DUF2007 domain-containing protein [Gemmataceae bacterium]
MTQLRTVAAFDTVYKADLAKAALEEASIPAVVTDREVVSLDWLGAPAVGGVKVQVAEHHLDRAEDLLNEKFAGDMHPFSEGVSEEELTRQALETAPEDEMPPEPADE